MIDIGERVNLSRQEKILLNIQDLLVSIDGKLDNSKAKLGTSNKKDKPQVVEKQKPFKTQDVESLTRKELLQIAKAYPKGTLGNYVVLGTEELREKIRKQVE